MAMETQDFGCNDRVKELKEFDESKLGVKGLLDSGITSIPRIFVHPPESMSDVVRNPDSQPLISIPVIDLSGIESPSERQKIVDQVKHAAKTWGFFQVINHGIPVSVQDATVSALNAFFEQPTDAKGKHYSRLPASAAGGVMYASNADLFHSAAAGWRDSLQVRRPPEDEEEAAKVPEICRGEVSAWFPLASGVAGVLMELLSEGLGLARGRLNEVSPLGRGTLVCHCYPYCPEPDRTVGFNSHTDGGMLTLVMQNQIQGLQVNHGGFWVDVEPERAGLIVNIGDLFQITSNDEYKSVQHRVVANSCKEARISVIMFFGHNKSDNDGCFGPLSELISPEKPAVYRDFKEDELNEILAGSAFGNKCIVERFKI